MRKTRVFASLVVLTAALAACGQTTSPPPAVQPVAQSGGFDILKAATPIKQAGAEAIALKGRLDAGVSIQSLEKVDIATLKAEDVEGNPFVYLVVTAPGKIGDPLDFAGGLTGKEWAGQGEKSPYSVAVIGASNARSILTYQEAGLGLLQRIAKLYGTLGRQNVKRIVSLTGGSDYYLQTKDGLYWNTYDGKRVDDATAATFGKGYAIVRAKNNDPKLLESLDAAWKDLFAKGAGAASVRPTNASKLEDFTLSDGSLDVEKAVADLKRVGARPSVTVDRGGTSQPAYESPWYNGNCAWFVCDHIHEGAMTSPYDQVAGGFAQYSTKFIDSFDQYSNPILMQSFRVRNGADRIGFTTNDSPIGCGPAAFTSLVWWYWKYWGINWYGTNYWTVTDPRTGAYDQPAYVTYGTGNQNSPSGYISYNLSTPYLPNSVVTRMVRPQSGYGDGPNEPFITARMGGYNFNGGTLVIPNSLHAGANTWLDQQNYSGWTAPLRMRGYFWYGVPFLPSPVVGEQGGGDTNPPMANVLRAKIGRINNPGQAEEPVIALFNTPNAFEAHYATVLRYKVVYRAGSVVDVLVKTTDHPNWSLGWSSLTNSWATAKGTFDLVPK